MAAATEAEATTVAEVSRIEGGTKAGAAVVAETATEGRGNAGGMYAK
mgnify:CR=1 FL=1